MIRTIRGFILCFWLFALQEAKAQIITVEPSSAIIEGNSRPGLATKIVLDKKFVDRAWIRKMKDLGRPDVVKGGAYLLKNIAVPTLRPEPVNWYSLVESTQEGIILFWAFDFGTHFISDTSVAFRPASVMLHEFAVQVYRDDLNLQIAEADKTLDAAVRQHDKQVDQGLKINQNIQKNKTEKIRLEKAILDNANDLVRLKNDSTSNKMQQGNLLDEIEKIRKVIEEKRSKLQKIE